MEDIKIYKKSILLRKKKILTKLTELLKEEAECVDASLVLWIWSFDENACSAQHSAEQAFPSKLASNLQNKTRTKSASNTSNGRALSHITRKLRSFAYGEKRKKSINVTLFPFFLINFNLWLYLVHFSLKVCSTRCLGWSRL